MPSFSLRTKLTLALLVTGLASASAVGLAARAILLQRFDRLLLESSFQNFREDVTAYVATYGSWEEAAAEEPFRRFTQRESGRGGPPPGPRPDGRRRPPPPPPPGVGARPPLPPGGPPAPRGGRGGPPPYVFLLLDPSGQRVLHGPEEYLEGKPIPDTLRAAAMPIEVDGRTAALALPLRDPNFNAYDNEYLRAIRGAVAAGVLIAALLSVLLGVFFGDRLSRSLRSLTRAIQAMSRGERPQQMQTSTGDEIGVMADVINRVSQDLEASHACIEQQADELRELSVRDSLTGLHNRRHFDDEAARAFAQARRYREPLTVLICDIDAFKPINDGFSHAVGDEVLRIVAGILGSQVRASDLAARYGGDEFVVVFQRQGALRVADLCDRIRERIEAYDWESVAPGLHVTVSMGLDDDPTRESVSAMLQAADARLYAAKHAGRNRIVA
jgi:diguanylate cyclase (GGDEF)-like protein